MENSTHFKSQPKRCIIILKYIDKRFKLYVTEIKILGIKKLLNNAN